MNGSPASRICEILSLITWALTMWPRIRVNENKELHRLEYWFLDWFDGAKLLLSPKDQAWTQMQEMLSA